MEEIKNQETAKSQEQEQTSSLNFETIYRNVLLNWYWYLLSIIIFLGCAFIYLRYKTPTFQATAKMLIKDDETQSSNYGRRNFSNANATTLGLIASSNGIENEVEILQSHTLAEQVVRDMKLYVEYKHKGRVKDQIVYKEQPVTVDVDSTHLDKLNSPISLVITRTGDAYHVTGSYMVPIDEQTSEGPFSIDRTLTILPAQIATRAGVITFTQNEGKKMKDGEVEKVMIMSPRSASYKFAGELSVEQTSKQTTIAQLTLVDAIPKRANDYLSQLVLAYNQQANDDKNEIAVRTEKFINSRLEKINNELGQTEGQLENYKKRNKLVELKVNSTTSVTNQNQAEQKLRDMETQVELLNSIRDFMNERGNRYQVIPSNVGLEDQSSTTLINKYNELVLERNRLLRSASPNSPVVEPITDQINDLNRNIKQAIGQSLRALKIQRNALASQSTKYNNEVAETPAQERVLTQIGRQQEVKSELYIMLLQKREENSISLAATADKGKLIDTPIFNGQVSPKPKLIYLIGLLIGIAIPSIILYLLNFFRYKIEGHDDVASLTKLPIIADVAVASNTAKTKADIVVHENTNNQMEEIFRSMRTNLQFMLGDGEKTIMFTSSTSGEGKTFTCANLAVSFALLGKKVIMVGLDIRKPRIAELFEINDHHHGITPLLIKENPTEEDVRSQILPSGVNKNLDLLMAGPIPPNPAELMTRKSLDIIFEHLKNDYDYILIDTAPVGLVTDTLQIGRVANATVYMCRADYTPRVSFDMINGLSEEKKLPNMCIVINGIDISKKKYGYYYGYGRYGKYGKYGRYGHYGHYGRYGSYGSYGNYGNYGSYGDYSRSHYGKKDDNSIKR